MALKDWEKNKDKLIWTKNNDIYIHIHRSIYGDGKFKSYNVNIGTKIPSIWTTMGGGNIMNIEFKNKNQAIKYVKEYIKKH